MEVSDRFVTTQNLSQNWDLDSIFPGGSDSQEFASYLDELEESLGALMRRLNASAPAWPQLVADLQSASSRVTQGVAFAGCLVSQNVKDQKAKLLRARVTNMQATMSSLMTVFEARLLELSDEAFEALLANEVVRPVAFTLRERRTNAKRKMDPMREILTNDLAVDGYHSWMELYDTVVGRMTVPVAEDGKVQELSIGQANTRFASPDRAFRAKLFKDWEGAWAKDAELFAATLNHLSGFRLSWYKHRGWDSFLQEPLTINRMSEATLNAMWAAVGTSKEGLKRFYERRAKLMGVDRMNWYDLNAPLETTTRKIPYDEAGRFIVSNFGRFSPRMAQFAQNALERRWVESEDRPGKAPGGYCTDLPVSKETRIFMTYSGTTDGVSTLAHELGHAFHTYVMTDLPYMAQEYAMNVAETASTFAEMLINAAAIADAPTKEEKVALLASKIGDSASFLMNIHARFLFETRFYEERKQGMVSMERLCELMETAQKEAYAGALGEYHPYFWASKLHFYATDVPFYNFPYTFGYLFSAGLYARARQEGPSFEQKYIDLLRDTGRMTVEDLAARHLGVDLTKPDFWLTGVQMALDDVEEFLALTEA